MFTGILTAMTIAAAAQTQPALEASTPVPPETPPGVAAPATTRPSADPRQPPPGLLTPIAENGGLPLIYNHMYDLTADQLRQRAAARRYERQIRKIRHEHFGQIKLVSLRQEGIEQLSEFIDPAAFAPMIEVLEDEADDVKLGMADHFALQDEPGQGALAWMAIYDGDPAIQNEALRRMTRPAGEPVLYILNTALRSPKHEEVNAAASLAAALNIIDTIPLLIFGQATVTGADESGGDLAWIAIQTQRAYVQNLVPVVGDASGAFQPVVGIVSEGVVMRVVDAVVIEYRTPVHAALINLTTNDWGQPTDYMGYNIKAWWEWYNTQYVPFKQEQAREAELARGDRSTETAGGAPRP